MELDPNKYLYIIRSLEQTIKNSPHRPLDEVCNEVSAANHIPVAAIYIICKKYIPNNNITDDQINTLIKFYKYDKVVDIV